MWVSLAAPVASFDWSECVSFDGLATCPECIGVCVPVHVYVRLSVCMNVCVDVCTFSGLRQSYAAASWLSLKLSGLAYLPCQLHSLWQPDDMGLCDGHDPPDVPPAPTPPPPIQASQQSVRLSKWSQKQADTRKVFGVFSPSASQMTVH